MINFIFYPLSVDIFFFNKIQVFRTMSDEWPWGSTWKAVTMATLPQKCLILSERTNLEHEHLKSRERELPSSQKKKGRRYQFKKCLCINLSFLALLFILHEGGLYTLNYPNDETWSHVKILLSCFLYGQNKLLRYEKMMVFFF